MAVRFNYQAVLKIRQPSNFGGRQFPALRVSHGIALKAVVSIENAILLYFSLNQMVSKYPKKSNATAQKKHKTRLPFV